jgi:hydrogenase-4 component F
VVAALVHSLNHSLAKCLAFWSVGRLGQAYGGHDIARMSGAFRASRVWGVGLLASFLALSGAAPFATFLSELAILQRCFEAANGLVFAALAGGLGLAFLGLTRHAIRLLWARSEAEPRVLRDSGLERLLVGATLIALLALGLAWPRPLVDAVTQAARVVGDRPRALAEGTR